MRALRLDPNGDLQLIALDPQDTLRAMQVAVGGLLEHIAAVPGTRAREEISLYGNEEARLLGMPFNALVELEEGGAAIDICGPILVAGADAEGEVRGLTDGELAAVRILTTRGVRIVQLPGMAPSLPALR